MKRSFKLLSVILCLTLSCVFIYNPSHAYTVSAKGYVIINADTCEVLAGDNIHRKLSMASTTKIMTALLTLENISNLKEVATVSYDAVFTVPAGYSTDLLKVGFIESITFLKKRLILS